ncbi:hypothetical protein MUK42_26611 [Musa troglodytarum]|uniref:Uncharacterized protein n=1 Tax=Musa troglodytarum TaxID=320322 RepID=A0A9E7FZU6_9LILI|nr:hypothetical protein MUK42_26611 [Musa troglodytarum]
MNRTVLIGRATLWGHHWFGVDVVEAFVFSSFLFNFFVFYINCAKCSGVSYIYENYKYITLYMMNVPLIVNIYFY